MFESFDSLDAMLEAMAAREEEANKNTTPEQAAIGYGDYFIRLWDTGMEGVLKIYGRIMTVSEFIEDEKSCGAENEEIEYEVTSLMDSYSRGYRFGWCYSVVESDGELGSTHVSTMFRKITEKEFEEAKARGWT